MLHDPRWRNPQTKPDPSKTDRSKPDPFALATLTAWLARQPAAGTYCYSDPDACLLAGYFAAHGFRDIEMAPGAFTHAGGRAEIPPVFDFVASEGAHTFGAALARARSVAGAGCDCVDRSARALRREPACEAADR
jgi:hypothetical protein